VTPRRGVHSTSQPVSLRGASNYRHSRPSSVMQIDASLQDYATRGRQRVAPTGSRAASNCTTNSFTRGKGITSCEVADCRLANGWVTRAQQRPTQTRRATTPSDRARRRRRSSIRLRRVWARRRESRAVRAGAAIRAGVATRGRMRLRILVDSLGPARIEFVDDSGHVVRSLQSSRAGPTFSIFARTCRGVTPLGGHALGQ
jgi:hypothetical protein